MKPLVQKKGFSLIELLVVILIVGILAAIAYPSYTAYILKSRRSDALTTLLTLQTQYEQYNAQNNAYPASNTNSNGTPLANSVYYSYTSITTSTGYTITATAIAPQTKDTGCGTLSIDNLGDQTPATCWSP